MNCKIVGNHFHEVGLLQSTPPNNFTNTNISYQLAPCNTIDIIKKTSLLSNYCEWGNYCGGFNTYREYNVLTHPSVSSVFVTTSFSGAIQQMFMKRRSY